MFGRRAVRKARREYELAHLRLLRDESQRRLEQLRQQMLQPCPLCSGGTCGKWAQ